MLASVHLGLLLSLKGPSCCFLFFTLNSNGQDFLNQISKKKSVLLQEIAYLALCLQFATVEVIL